MSQILLGVNIDHIATLRNARGTCYPEPAHLAAIAECAGADGITIHLREDRRHINDRDVAVLAQTLQTRMNLEMAVTDEMVDIALKTKPAFVCLVPEKREELTTEGGLNVVASFSKIASAVSRLNAAAIQVSLFIDPENAQIDAAIKTGAAYIELHTGKYADAPSEDIQQFELMRVAKAATYASQAGIKVNAGHGLNYHNVKPIAALPEIIELNIGHAIVARALVDGFGPAVAEMKRLMVEGRNG
ncbi:pyridoxine 5'-phosphate synthase [Psychromonas ingrahamii 37]|uniref:Pyridoxine 5'-phosphate synthase n=1 Tax=Psychromonas ingrahamii (strain DSM 17664 / CCUG 51855 / 37) TaxID=357804 RepID=A1SSN1_PSYIN|nr:pyridoxine 5'-phosphate synthase [Psychromonas ingrahamii]ABM02496.1 pyridoxine 5'-phosphate synthase [Psychromonas ingrahamii 37]